MGVRGIALGTAISEWSTLLVALLMVHRLLRESHRDGEAFWPWPRIVQRERLRQVLNANADIMVRTLFLLLGFAAVKEKRIQRAERAERKAA